MSEKIIKDSSGFDVQKIRKDFPFLSQEVYGYTPIYLDSAASAQKPNVLIETESNFYAKTYGNVHRGMHYFSEAASEKYEESRKQIAKFLNAGSENEIVFTKSGTESLNIVAYGLAHHLKEGDEIVLTVAEHHANIIPWHLLRERLGVVLKWVDLDEDGQFSIELFEQAMSSKTKIVALTQMSNVLGTYSPLSQVVKLARDASNDCLVVVDGSQGAVHCSVDVTALDADFYALTGHKLYAGTGIGVLWGKPESLELLNPFMGGGEMIDVVTKDGVTYKTPPARFEAGTPAIAQAVGLSAAINYLQGIGFEAIRDHEQKVFDYAKQEFSNIKDIQLLKGSDQGGPILSFVMPNIHAHDVSMFLDKSGISLRAGKLCAYPLLEYLGHASVCRTSFAMYNTVEEVDKFVEAIDKVISFFAKHGG